MIIMLTSGISLLLSASALIILDAEYINTTINKRLTIQASIIAENSIAALAFQDQETVQQILDSLSVDPNIAEAVINTVDQKRFANYQRIETDNHKNTWV